MSSLFWYIKENDDTNITRKLKIWGYLHRMQTAPKLFKHTIFYNEYMAM